MNQRPYLAIFLILLALILGSFAAAAISPQLAQREPQPHGAVPSERASAVTPTKAALADEQPAVGSPWLHLRKG